MTRAELIKLAKIAQETTGSTCCVELNFWAYDNGEGRERERLYIAGRPSEDSFLELKGHFKKVKKEVIAFARKRGD